MFTISKLLLAIGTVGAAFLFIYLVRRAAYRQLASRGEGKGGHAARPS